MTRYSPALDGLRGVAIILVLLHHLCIYRPTRGLDGWIASVPLFGWSGVDLFFVLSGFLITGILIDARGSDRYFRSFYARRTLRIFPLYYLVLALVFLVLPGLDQLHTVLAGPYPDPPSRPYWLYYSNASIAERGFLHGWIDVAWSLAIEEQFYIVWALVVWLCAPRWLGAVCAAILLLSPLARMAALDRGADTTAVYTLTWFRADTLAVGALLAWLVRRDWLPRMARFAPVGAVAGVIALIAIIFANGDSWWWHRKMEIAGFSVTALTGGAMLVAAISRPDSSWWVRAMSSGWLRAFGKYSYSLYLFHLPVMRAVRAYVFNPADYTLLASAPWLGQLIFYAAAILPALGLSWLSWRAFEAPILSLKERFPY